MKITRKMLKKAGIEVAGAFGDELPQVSIDSRTLRMSELFWALRGDRFNGHDFISNAFSHGASIAAVSEDWIMKSGNQREDRTYFVMEDTLLGMQELARVVRENVGAIVIGVTGSYGKTTTRALLAAGLSRSGVVACSQGNLNNHIGLPLTLLNIQGDENYIVLEMGANHSGEIAFLCEIAKPDMGLITAIGEAHLAGFGSVDGVQQAKGELFQAMAERGLAIVNLDDERVRDCAISNKRKVGYTMTTIPEDWRWSVYHGHIVGQDAWSRSILTVEGMKIQLQLPGRHFASAALAAFATSVEAGADPELTLEAMVEVKPLPGRGNIILLERGIEILDETYNANPVSIEAALLTLSNRTGYRVAILGDMYELGKYKEDEHRRIGRSVFLEEIDRVIFIGQKMAWAAEEAELSGHTGVEYIHEETYEELTERLLGELPEGAGIMIKGSRAMHLDQIVEAMNRFGIRK